MTDLHSTGAREGKVLRPGLWLDLIDQARDAIEPLLAHGLCACQAKRDRVNLNRHLARNHLECLTLAPTRIKIIVGDHFKHVDLVERIEDPCREFRTPPEAHAIAHQLPQPPQPPPPPPHPPPPLLEPPPPLTPSDDERGP